MEKKNITNKAILKNIDLAAQIVGNQDSILKEAFSRMNKLNNKEHKHLKQFIKDILVRVRNGEIQIKDVPKVMEKAKEMIEQMSNKGEDKDEDNK